MAEAESKEFRELLVIVHPNWLAHASIFGVNKTRAKQFIRAAYSKGRPNEVDFKRYRKAMFDVYGRAIIDAAKKRNVFVAIFAIPMGLEEYMALKRGRSRIKKAEHANVLRFIDFAKEQLGSRLIVINSPGLQDLKHDTERLYNIIARKKIRFSQDFVVRAGGELSLGCVQSVVNHLNYLLRPSKAFVDKRICGDIISNFPKRRVARRTQRAKPPKRKAKPIVRRASLRRKI